MKILYITKTFPDVRGVKWVKTFSEYNHSTMILTETHKKELDTWNYKAQVLEIGSQSKTSIFYAKKTLKTVLLKFNEKKYVPDIIVLRDIFQSKVALSLSKHYKTKLIIDVADNYPEVVFQMKTNILGKLISYFLNKIEKEVLLESDNILVVTEQSKNYLVKKYEPQLKSGKVNVIRNVPEKKADIKKENLSGILNKKVSTDNIRLIYIGSYVNRIRDLSTVINAMSKIGVKVELDIYTFNKERVEAFLRQFNPSSHLNIRVFPPVKNSSLEELLEQYDIGLVPHKRGKGTDYTEPNKLYDYVRSLLPVLTSDNPALIDTINNLQVGDYYEEGNTESFIKAVNNIVENYSYYQNNCLKESHRIDWEQEVKEVMHKIII